MITVALLSSPCVLSPANASENALISAIQSFTDALFILALMLSIAAGLAESLGAEAIVIAAHSGDHAIYPDCRNDFLLKMEAAITAGTYAGIRILAPFANVDKTEIIRRGAKLGIDYSQTWSCYCGGTLHCGHCGTCTERKESFALAGIPDPTLYKE